MNCPTCAVELKIADRQGVEIDYCPKCRGVWLYRGELDKIIDRAQSQMQPQQTQEFRDHDPRSYDDDDDRYKQQYGYKKRRRGFLGDLFDFD
jgi:Zn-finger nucleic acid-binding protein